MGKNSPRVKTQTGAREKIVSKSVSSWTGMIQFHGLGPCCLACKYSVGILRVIYI